MNASVAERADWLSESDAVEAFLAARRALRDNKKLKAAVQETRRAPFLSKTVKEAREYLKTRRLELEEDGFSVVGSVATGLLRYYDGETPVGALSLVKSPPKG